MLLTVSLKGQQVKIKDTEYFNLASDVVGVDYKIDVFLPSGYSGDQNYPVVYVLDAEYNFGMVTYATRRLIKDDLVPPIVLVGISYDTSYQGYTNSRQRDYTPTKTRLPHTGGGDAFLSFIESELIPVIEQKYSVSQDRTICGHSLGGLIGYHSMLKRPKLFQRYLLVSPSLWYDNKLIFDLYQDFEGDRPSLALYSAIGEMETRAHGQRNDMVADLEAYIGLLRNGDKLGVAITHEVLNNETHRSVFPRAFTNGLRALFGK